MKPSKFIIYCVSALLLAQFFLCAFALYKKHSLATDDTLPVLELNIYMPSLYRKGNNFLSLHEKINLVYNEADPLVEKLDFTKTIGGKTTTSRYISFKRKQIYLNLKQEDNKLSIEGYSTKKPKEGFFLKADVRTIDKALDKDRVSISPDIQNLRRFNFEGDKWEVINKVLNEASDFNNKLSRELREKKITQKEHNQQCKKAQLLMRVSPSGDFFILDCIVDGTSLKNLP